MRIASKQSSSSADTDMTPMIDMTFQLIAFFMVLMNFSDSDVNQDIRLPSSELARPPEVPLESPLVLQLTARGTVLFSGDDIPVKNMDRPLSREAEILRRTGKTPEKATVVIRGDAGAKTGVIQELMRICQDHAFENFNLRVKQETP